MRMLVAARAVGLAIAVAGGTACHPPPPGAAPPENPMTHPALSLAARLVAQHYAGLFLTAPRGADRVLAEARADELAALVADPAADGEARFLASELWFDGHGGPPPLAADALGALYARALAGRWTVFANPWGLPREVGPVGAHLLQLGAAAVPALRAHLDDPAPVSYAGSEEATVGNGYAYRVKDLAAFYAARLAPAPYAVLPTPAERDREIARLAGLLADP